MTLSEQTEFGWPKASDAEEPRSIVLILKKTQGSVWSEAGQTQLCPTLAWLTNKYGAGQYELRLKQGKRTLCMTLADCRIPAPARVIDLLPVQRRF